MAKTIRRRTAIGTAIAAGALAAPMQSWPKGSYPAEPANRIVVPFAAGGTADCLGRLVAQILSESMNSAFVVENWTGPGGNLSAEIVAKARPDGRTLLLGTVGIVVSGGGRIYPMIAYRIAAISAVGVAAAIATQPPLQADDYWWPQSHRPTELLETAPIRRGRTIPLRSAAGS